MSTFDATEGAHPARDRWALLFALATWLAATIATHVYVARYASPIPFMDDMELLGGIVPGAHPTWDWYWVPANEHRIPIPRAIYMAGLALSHDFRSGMYVQVWVQSLLALALIFFARKLRGRASFADAALPLLLLHWGNAENFLLGMQITIAVPIALCCSFVMLAMRSTRAPSARTALAMVACVLLMPLNGGFGLMQIPPLVLYLAVGAIALLRSREPAERRAGAVLAAGTLAALALVAAYFVGYESPPNASRTYELVPVLRTALQFLSLNLGPIAERHRFPAQAATIAFGALAAWFALRAWKERDLRWRAGGVLAGLAAATTIALAIGAARSPTGYFAGVANRYVILPVAFCVSAYLGLCAFGPRRIASIAQALLCIGLFALQPFDVRYGARKGAAHLGAANELEESVRAGLPFEEIVASNWRAFYPNPHGFAGRLLLLRAAGYPPCEAMPPGADWPRPDEHFMFTPRPLAVRCPPGAKPRRVLGENAFLLLADSEIVLPVPPGATKLSARFGMLPNAWRPDSGGEPSDGVRFEIVVREPSGAERVLHERTLAPYSRDADRGVQRVELDVAPAPDAQILLRTSNVSGAHRERDWGFWSSVDVR